MDRGAGAPPIPRSRCSSFLSLQVSPELTPHGLQCSKALLQIFPPNASTPSKLLAARSPPPLLDLKP